MCDSKKTKKVLVEELRTLRSRVTELERIEAERKHAEQALRESEQRYAKAEQIGYFGHWERNLVEDKATWSKGSYRLFGVDPTQFEPSYENFLNLLHPSDRNLLKGAIEAAISNGKSFDIEYRIVRPDGTERVLHSVAEVRFDSNGRPMKLVGTAHDITERKQAEQVLRKARAQLEARVEERTATLARTNALLKEQIAERERAEQTLKTKDIAIESSINAIAFVDLEGNLTYVNDSFVKMWGYRNQRQVLGRPAVQFWADEDKASEVLEIVHSKGSWVGELTARRKDGSVFNAQLSATLIRDDGGSPMYLMSSFVDITEHRRAEEALRASEKKYRALTESLKELVYHADPATLRATYVNRSVKEIYGYSVEEWLQDPNSWENTIHPEDKDRAVQAFLKARENLEDSNVQYRIVRKDGTVRWVDDRFSWGKNQQGQVISLNGIMYDISERKRVEEKLKQYQFMVESAHDAIFFKNLESRYVIANNETLEAFGLSREQVIGKNDYEIMSDHEEAGKNIEDDQFVFETDKLKEVTKHMTGADGKKRWFQAIKVPQYDDKGNIIGLVGVARDITGHKRAEEALRESEERYKALFEGAAEGILVADIETKQFMYVNPAVCRMLGYTEDEVKQMGVWDIHPKEHLEHVISEFEAQARGDKTLAPNIPCLRKDGTIMYADIDTARVVVDGRGCNVGFLTDITERKKAEEQLQRARDELEIRVEQRTADLARAIEELRSEIAERKKAERKLLTSQKKLRSLASELSLAEERLRRRMATDVHDRIGQNLAISKIKLESLRQSASSSELAGALEEIGRLIAQTIESSRSLTFELSPPVLYELGFEAAVEWLVRQMRQQHGLSTEFKDDGQSKPLVHDVRVLLFQAVRELLVNVAKHAQARNVMVSARRVGNQIQVSVEDDGVGFDTSEVSSRDYKTGGFGLFSIRERLGDIGGRLDIESGPGRGTRVALVAPVDQHNRKERDRRK